MKLITPLHPFCLHFRFVHRSIRCSTLVSSDWCLVWPPFCCISQGWTEFCCSEWKGTYKNKSASFFEFFSKLGLVAPLMTLCLSSTSSNIARLLATLRTLLMDSKESLLLYADCLVLERPLLTFTTRSCFGELMADTEYSKKTLEKNQFRAN